MRYIDDDGEPVHTDFDDLIVGITLEQLRRVDRRLRVAGGPSKYKALRAALLGGWLNIAVTDATTTRSLIDTGTEKSYGESRFDRTSLREVIKGEYRRPGAFCA